MAARLVWSRVQLEGLGDIDRLDKVDPMSIATGLGQDALVSDDEDTDRNTEDGECDQTSDGETQRLQEEYQDHEFAEYGKQVYLDERSSFRSCRQV
jgi:hypothetical protein